jgi:hypothetical protein
MLSSKTVGLCEAKLGGVGLFLTPENVLIDNTWPEPELPLL